MNTDFKICCLNNRIKTLEAEATRIVFIDADYTLPDSTDFRGILVVKNVTSGDLDINTITADKLEGLDTQPIPADAAFTIVKYDTNDYRVI